jgi:hypothetical protein
MSLTLSESATTFELPPAGPQAAICTRVLDLGSQLLEYQGEKRQSRKVLLTWRLAEARIGGEPHSVSRRFTASLHEKSALRAFLKSWRGRDFTPAELAAFDLRKLLGAVCLLNLAHTRRNGRDYADIVSVSPLPKGMAAPAPLGDFEAVLIDLSDPSTFGAVASLSDRLRAQIEASPEWKAAQAAAAPAARPAPSRPAPAAEFASDDIPF